MHQQLVRSTSGHVLYGSYCVFVLCSWRLSGCVSTSTREGRLAARTIQSAHSGQRCRGSNKYGSASPTRKLLITTSPKLRIIERRLRLYTTTTAKPQQYSARSSLCKSRPGS